MEEGNVSENSLTSAAAFVEGGIQEACDDACSICLESFCDSDPSTVTSCKHEFHLQCILEWCQRSSQCPMCWQPISFKDPSSQELLDAVEHERNIRLNPPRNTTIFHHPTLGDFELQHLPVSAGESELEERIIQHLAAAAAMGRARQIARREGQRNRSSGQGRPQFLVFSTHPNRGSVTSAASPLLTIAEDSTQLNGRPSSAQANQLTATASGSSATGNEHGTPSRNSQDRAGPSDSQSLSETLKSRISAFSTRYKDSITKSTRGWKERLFARNSSIPEPPSIGAHREVEQGTAATVSGMIDHLHIAEGRTTNAATISSNFEGHSTPDPTQQQTIDRRTNPSSSSSEDETRAPLATTTTSASN